MKTKDLTRSALLIAASMLLSYVESLIPIFPGVPGIKLGLANIAVLFSLYRLNAGHAWCISLLRVFLSALLFGNAVTLAYSITGAVLSLAGSCLLKKTERFSPVGVSITGAVLHNVGQIAMAAILMGTSVIAAYLPVLLVSGIASGILIGIAAALLISRLPL